MYVVFVCHSPSIPSHLQPILIKNPTGLSGWTQNHTITNISLREAPGKGEPDTWYLKAEAVAWK
jgi:hypothetical protein